ncbi:glycoside hydrolase family 31 protein [Sediminispirochaeta smaragdinae]|uniref:Glycoside hydrolase family 31 n=1 Tax=Sediminispirochaeta smaragdinae (strain DSM 11293 / JCM 15392 / SEBR 4228) TaxID=573413 RepID=E1RAJ2_SEDSS|nr:glycoside hydrolase family 31 protein [Sediminispirochaeta smaragdinae]ADK82360.1 glycoside hydrolase family 31 [Sediminispirochaeta smaragdinae DSM 11293]
MIKQEKNRLIRRQDKELLCIEPWGKNSLRVRATQSYEILPDDDFALQDSPEETLPVRIEISGKRASIQNGKISCDIYPSGKMCFLNQKGEIILEEYDRNRFKEEDEGFNSALELDPRAFDAHTGTDYYKLTVRFEAVEGEKIYGMGQYQQPFLNHKGCLLELSHRNSQASIPFALSSRGYGFLWNNPAIGRVTFGRNITEWIAESTRQMDYWITAGDSPAEIHEQYMNVTGKPPVMPEYGTGFWQCKMRYQTQEELLNVAREYKKRGLPISVIVADFFHWPHQGDWCFDPEYWPDPEGMVKELKSMGIELMVSIWPTVDKESRNYKRMEEEGLLTRSEKGSRMTQLWDACFADMTNPATRSFVWSELKKNYYDKGIRIFWLDEAEPEFTKYEYSNYRYWRGSDLEIGNLFPKEYAKMAYEGMKLEGQKNIINLIRCAWAGSQKFGALLWSGDIDSSFRALRDQLAAGLNTGLAGIPWWTTDIGGFHGGNIASEEFRECFVRWFQFGTFCPVMRLHGDREPHKEPLGTSGGGLMPSGADNEVWSYGEDVYQICKKYLRIREHLRPYLMRLMEKAHEKGTPVMRPLFYDFPQDDKAWNVDDEYMLGESLIVCPVLYEGRKSRAVYLPGKSSWRDLHTGALYEGGTSFSYDTPLDVIPVFAKKGELPEII